MAKQSKAQQETVGRVMHEFKVGDLVSHGRTVKNPKQAIAIALHEAGASKYESKETNAKNLRHTKRREREEAGGEKTREELYEEAKRRDIPGRSKMTKGELQKALSAA